MESEVCVAAGLARPGILHHLFPSWSLALAYELIVHWVLNTQGVLATRAGTGRCQGFGCS